MQSTQYQRNLTTTKIVKFCKNRCVYAHRVGEIRSANTVILAILGTTHSHTKAALLNNSLTKESFNPFEPPIASREDVALRE
jgi:hypothetical protein